MSTYPSVPWSSDQGSYAWKSWFQRLQNYLQDGIYTPTLTNVLNLDSSTAYQCQFLRIGDTVSVSGRIDANSTAAGAAELGISLPPNIGSKFSAVEDCSGVAAMQSLQESGGISADITNDRATLAWIAVSTSNQTWFFTFTYQIIG